MPACSTPCARSLASCRHDAELGRLRHRAHMILFTFQIDDPVVGHGLEGARQRIPNPVGNLIGYIHLPSLQVDPELRLLGSARFDSRPLLSVVLAGDARLTEKLRRDDLLPLGSRIRMRLAMEYAGRDQLLACLEHLLASAGNAALMTPQLRAMLCEHAAGNYRVLTTMAAQLLGAALQRQAPVIDEKLYFDVFADARRPDPVKPRARVTR